MHKHFLAFMKICVQGSVSPSAESPLDEMYLDHIRFCIRRVIISNLCPGEYLITTDILITDSTDDTTIQYII